MKEIELMMNGKLHKPFGKDVLGNLLRQVLQIGKINKVTLEYEGSKSVNVFTLDTINKCDCCGQVLNGG